jgi:hypothetical protein
VTLWGHLRSYSGLVFCLSGFHRALTCYKNAVVAKQRRELTKLSRLNVKLSKVINVRERMTLQV